MQSLSKGKQPNFEHSKGIRQLCAKQEHSQKPTSTYKRIVYRICRITRCEFHITHCILHVFRSEDLSDAFSVIRIIQ